LATWGIASVKYGNALKQQRNEDETTYQGRKTDLDNKFAALKAQLKGQRDSLATTQQAELNALVSQLSAQYDALTIKLHSDELNFLSTNGYVWMQCNSYSQPSSIICNNYNYQVFVGSSTCTVMCYKNVMQNKETLHAAPVCSSPYIPADCYSQAKYDAEYNAAYNTGYTQQYPNGTHDGQIAGNTKGSADGKADGNANGDSDGYNDGYNTGYKDEYTTAYNSGYNSRYNDGYEAGYTSGYNDGYNSGYDAGYSDGYNSYVPPSSGLVSNSMMNRNSSSVKAYDQSILQPKFKTGYSEGFRDAKLVLSLQQTDKA
jgi:flagellar biosynthesis/type III secretory pathway protein FliH